MTTTEIHAAAMEYAQRLDDVVRRLGRVPWTQEHNNFATMAATLECLAVTACELRGAGQPTHGILCRSAAWLLIESGRRDEALTMVRRGLAAGSPEWLETELEDAGSAALDLST